MKRLGKNNFPILEKKQRVRTKFINELKKQNKLNEKENIFTKKSLFNCLILTLNLKEFIKLNESLSKNNDLQQLLLEISVLTLNYPYKNKLNLKVIIYYFAHMFNILFKDTKDINLYLHIENSYLNKINNTVNEPNIIFYNEMYPFLKINLFCLGKIFKNEYKEKNLILTEENKHQILIYFNNVYLEIFPFVIENYENIKKLNADILPFENTHSLANMTTLNLDNESNVYSLLNNNNKYNDFRKLSKCLFYFLRILITDVSNGKEILKELDINLKQTINKENEQNKFKEIFFLYILKYCKKKKEESKIVIFSIIEYLCGRVLKDLNNNYFYFYDIIISYYLLILSDESLQDKAMKLFAKIFIEEIKTENFKSFFFIKLNDLLGRKKYNSNFELILPLFMNISIIYKEENENIKIKTLKVLSSFLEKYSDKNILFSLQSNYLNEKLSLNSDFFSILIANFEIINYNFEKNEELVKEYLNFYISFLLFLNSNFNYPEFQDLTHKKVHISHINFYLYKLEILSENSLNYVPFISSLIKTLIYYVKVQCISTPNTSYLIYKNLSLYYKDLIKTDISHFSFIPYLSYYIILFILIETIKTYKLPISLNLIHNNIHKEVKNLDENYSNILNEIDINNLFSKDYNEELIIKFEKDIKNNFNKCQDNKLNKSKYEQIMDIIYSKIFGTSANLFLCVEPQLKSSERYFESHSNSNQLDMISEGKYNNSFINSMNDDRSNISTELKDIKRNSILHEHNINVIIPLNNNNISFNLNNYNFNNTSFNDDNDENLKY